MTDRNKLSGTQFMFTVACYFQSTTLLTAFLVKVTLQNTWVVAITGSLLILPFFLMLFYMVKVFPGKNLIQINDAVFGKVGGKIISCFYLFFFLSLTSLNFRDIGDFINHTIMGRTPTEIIVIVFAIITMWAVKSGINVSTRFNTAFSALIFFFIVFDTIMVYNFLEFHHAMPFLDIKPKEVIQGINIIMTIPFGEIVIILMIIPNVNAPYKKIKRNFFIGFAIGALSLLIVVFREIFVLGSTLDLFVMPSLQTLKLIYLGPAISRVEIVLVLILMILSFTKSALLLYATVVAFSQIFNIKSPKSVVIPLGLVVIIYSLHIFEDVIKHGEIGSNVTPLMWIFFEFFLPFITFLTLIIRRMPQKQKALLRGIK